MPLVRELGSFEANAAGPVLDEFKRLRVQKYLNAVAWNADGSRLAGLSDFGHTVTVWETARWTVVNEYNRYSGGYSFNSLAYLPDGTLLTSAPVGKSPDPRYETLGVFSLLQWEPDTGRLIRYVPDPVPNLGFRIGNTDEFAVSPDGSLVAGIMEGSREGHVLVFETRGWTLAQHLVSPPTPQHPDTAWCLAFSPDSRELAVGTVAGRAHVFGLIDARIRLSFVAYPGDTSCDAIAFSADGRVIATGRGEVAVGTRDDGFVRLWHTSDGSHVTSLESGALGNVTRLAWSGAFLAASYDRSLRVWDAAIDPPHPALQASTRTFSVAFSPDGTLAATHANEVALYRAA